MDYQWLAPGERLAVRPLLLLGDEEPAMLARYENAGDLLVATHAGVAVGVALFVPDAARVELKNLAVAPAFRRQGIASALVKAGCARYAAWESMLVGTGDADFGNMRFYRRLGFRFCGVRRDFFAQYAKPLFADGLQLQDMVMLSRALPGS